MQNPLRYAGLWESFFVDDPGGAKQHAQSKEDGVKITARRKR